MILFRKEIMQNIYFLNIYKEDENKIQNGLLLVGFLWNYSNNNNIDIIVLVIILLLISILIYVRSYLSYLYMSYLY